MEQDARCAVSRERVVIGRPLVQFIYCLNVVEKNPTYVFERRASPIDVNVFLGLAISRAHANHVALVGNDVVDLVLAKKTCEGRVTLAFFFTGLDRNRKVILTLEAKAHHDMGDRFAGPIDGNNIARVELAQIVSAGFPTRIEVGLSPIIAISYVVERY